MARERMVAAVERAWMSDDLRRQLSLFARSGGYATYLVGGALRDLLLEREVSDWDLAGHGMIDLARAFATEHDLRLVIMHQEMPTARVILRPGDPLGFIDLAELRAPTIVADLMKRDFTVNALAWDIRGARRIVDPTGGLSDLRQAVIRAPRREAFTEDPLRALRAIRFAAQLGFSLDESTGEWVAEFAARIHDIAGERVGLEMIKLFGAPHAADALQAAADIGALEHLVPPLAAMRGIKQGGFHHLDVLGHTLLTLHEAERAINHPDLFLPRSADTLRVWLQERENSVAVRMAALFHDTGKPLCHAAEDGHVRFLGHADESAMVFLELARRWTLPSHLRRQVVRMIRLHMRPLELASSALRAEEKGQSLEGAITLRAIRRLMRDAEPAAIGLLLLAVADRSACRGPASEHEQRGRIYEIFDDMLVRYIEWLREQRKRPRLIDGATLLKRLNIKEGPVVGELLDAIAEAYADREINSEREALSLARRLLREMKD